MKKRHKILRFTKALMIVFFGLVFGFIIVKSKFNQNEILCKKIEIEIKENKGLQFIREVDILKVLNQGNGSFDNKLLENIDLKEIEKLLEKNDFIDNAEVYTNFEGILKIDIVQKKPLYRIINNNNVSYYISEKSYKVPLSANFTPRLIIATGYIPNVEELVDNKINNDLDVLIKHIHSDSFWDAMIAQVEVKKNGDFVLVPKLKGHTVLLGSIENIDNKFEKLKTFYKKALNKTNWKQYKQINLKYHGQLICSK